jgi:hypothetical protein
MLSLAGRVLSIGKKLFLVLIVYVLITGVFMNTLFGKKSGQKKDSIANGREQIYKTINDPELNKTKEGKLTIALYRGITCRAIGEGCTNNPADGNINFNKSFFGGIASIVSSPLSVPPASGVYWAYSGLENAGFVPTTYAAEGLGFSALKPFINLWTVFRDFAYMILVLVIVAIGFMVMFRMKINAQTVISAENALPRIVVALLLITFSFAIAGFMIDIMYVLTAVGISLLSGNGQYFNAAQYQNNYLTAGPGELFTGIFPSGLLTLLNVGNALLGILPGALNLVIRSISMFFTLILANNLITAFSPMTRIFDGIGAFAFNSGNVISSILHIGIIGFLFTIGAMLVPQLVLAALFFFTLLFLFFRLFFLLLRTYLQILIMIIFSPVILLASAIPGKNAFGFWFKNLFVEVLTFPIVILVLVLGSVIVNQIAANGDVWKPPFLYGIDANAFTTLIGMGMILIIPDIIKMVKEALGAKGTGLGLGLGTFFAAAGTGAGGVMGTMQQYSSLRYTAQHLPGPALKLLSAFPGFRNIEKDVKDSKHATPPPGTGPDH